jgi:hypothetical protein
MSNVRPDPGLALVLKEGELLEMPHVRGHLLIQCNYSAICGLYPKIAWERRLRRDRRHRQDASAAAKAIYHEEHGGHEEK